VRHVTFGVVGALLIILNNNNDNSGTSAVAWGVIGFYTLSNVIAVLALRRVHNASLEVLESGDDTTSALLENEHVDLKHRRFKSFYK